MSLARVLTFFTYYNILSLYFPADAGILVFLKTKVNDTSPHTTVRPYPMTLFTYLFKVVDAIPRVDMNIVLIN